VNWSCYILKRVRLRPNVASDFKSIAVTNVTHKYQWSEQAAVVLAEDHAEIDTLIAGLLSALDEGDKSAAFARLDVLWARLAVHIRAEHLCLFPTILGANFSDTSSGPTYQEAQRAIDQLRLDHEFFMRELGTSVNAIRNQDDASDHEVVNKQFREVRRSVVEIQTRLAKHNELEEHHVYKWVNVLLDETKRSALLTRIRRELENTPPRFSLGP
jgi:hemerythrin superfamily protein